MKTHTRLTLVTTLAVFLAGMASAQQFEAVHGINPQSTSGAKAALDNLMKDDAMKGARVTMYALEFGENPASHLIVEDFDGYGSYMKSRDKRVASHGWSRYQLATDDSEYVGSTLVAVVDDHGAQRHTAGYLVAFLIHTTDAGAYRDAIAELDEAIDNPGVLRLVATRSGGAAYTHAVLIGGKDFKAVGEYLDELFASDAFADFVAKVGDTRKVVGVDWYRRVGTWGD